MARVRVDMMVSLDGCATTTDQTPENPFGDDWGRLTEHYAATRTFRARVFGDTTGAGTTGLDDEQAAAYFEGVGAELMGAGMFGLHAHPDDPEWRGWWGGADVRIGGGPTTVRPFLTAGLVDELRLLVVPIVLGSGIRIWDGLRGLERDYAVRSQVAESGVVHVTFTRR